MIMVSLNIKDSSDAIFRNLMDISFISRMVSLENFGISSDWDDKETTLEITSCFVDRTVDDPDFVGVLEPWRSSLTKLSSIPMWLLNINESLRFPLPMDMFRRVYISSAVSIFQISIGIFNKYTIAIIGVIIKNNIAHIWSDRLTKLSVHPLGACISFLMQR